MNLLSDHTLKGTALILLATLFSVITYLITEYALIEVDPFLYGFYFFFLASAAVTPYYWYRYGRKELTNTFLQNQGNLLQVMILVVIGVATWFYVVDEVGSTVTALVYILRVVFSAGFGMILLKEKVNAWEAIGIILAFLGIVLVSYENADIFLIPVLIGIASVFIWSWYSYAVKKTCYAVSPSLINFYRIWAVSIALLLLVILRGNFQILPMEVLFVALINGLLGAVGFHVAFLYAHQYLRITVLNTLASITPVFVAIGAYFAFGQVPTLLKVVGGCITIGGVLLIILFRKSKVEDNSLELVE